MARLTRRTLLLSGLATAAVPPRAVLAADAAPAKNITKTLARYIVTASYAQLPGEVREQGVRTLLNWVGVAVGGSRHDAVETAVAALGPFSGPAQASLLGRRERFDIMTAAFLNGVAGHVLDYDDTHPRTIVHPSTVVAPAVLALAEMKPVSGQDFLNALVLGVETACRVGNAVSPEHYDAGWHITGTAGVFGAAAAAGKLMNLTEQQMTWALGLAASQPVGLRESFGSMNKSFNPGRAAADGIFAAVLAAKNFQSSDEMIEAPRGWANTISTRHDYAEITGELGQRYEAAKNTYKPFPCGIVIHPAIDAAIKMGRENKIDIAAVERIDLKVHPLVLDLTGKKTPATGLESKFSIYHAVAVALIEGAGGQRQFSDRAARDPAVVALRGKVVPTVDPAIKQDQVDMTVVFKDGRKLHRFIEHAVGSLEVPMTDADMDLKVLDLADGILPKDQATRVIDRCRKVETLANAAEIAAVCRV
jgi:2-methylcitrate dehydratase PrpD